MRITFILPTSGLVGGVRVVLEYASRLQERGHEVNIVYPLVPIIIKSNFDLNSIRSQCIGTVLNLKKGVQINWFELKANLIRVPTIDPKYLKIRENIIPDADILVATAWETAYSVNQLSLTKGKKFYFIQHYEIWDVWNDKKCWDDAEKIATNSDKICLTMADIVPQNKELKSMKTLVDTTYKMPLKKITISSWLKELIETKFNEKIEAIIMNGVNFDLFYKENTQRSEDKIRILMPYRNIIWKGTDDGIEALKIVKQKYPNVEFILYGLKPKTAIPEWIKMRVKISDEELRALYNSADIFIYPSWTEGFGLPPMEAMACGCAVVATNTGGVPDYSIHEKTVLTTPPKKPEILARNIIRLIENERFRKMIAANGYNYIKQFTWNKATDDLEAVFQNEINKHK